MDSYPPGSAERAGLAMDLARYKRLLLSGDDSADAALAELEAKFLGTEEKGAI